MVVDWIQLAHESLANEISDAASCVLCHGSAATTHIMHCACLWQNGYQTEWEPTERKLKRSARQVLLVQKSQTQTNKQTNKQTNECTY